MKSGIETLADDFIKKAESQGWVNTTVHSSWGSNFSMVYLKKGRNITIALLTDVQFRKFTFAHVAVDGEETTRIYKKERYFKKYQKEVEKLFEN
jgi:hypothetical protein